MVGAAARVRRRQQVRWPRGPQLNVAADATEAMASAVRVQRPKAEKPPRVDIPQLAGCQRLDQRVVPPLPGNRPLRIMELFAGVGSATQALVRLGYQVGEVVACEAWGAARQVHQHALEALGEEFPAAVGAKAGAQLHHHLPQDIRLVSRDHLHSVGPVDLVVAGWPYQGNSAAGDGQGLDDPRSGLFSEMLRVFTIMQTLHQEWGQPLGYLIEHVAAGYDRRKKVLKHFEAVRGLLGPEVVLDAALLGSRAHRLRAWWTNLEGIPLLRAAVAAQVRPPGLFVHQVLGPGRRARPPKTVGVAPWAKVETLGAPRRALNTFVSYGGSYAFSRGGGGVLACTQPDGRVTFEEPTSEERELAMGFPRGFTAAPGVSEATRQELLGQAMDLNLVMWLLAACQVGGLRRLAKLQAGGEAGQARAPANFAVGAQEKGAGGARGLSCVSPPPQMGARDTSKEGFGTQPGAGDTSTEGSGPGREDGRAEGAGKRPGGMLEGRSAEATARLPSMREGPRGVEEKGWLVESQLAENDRSQVAAVVEKNCDLFAFSLEEIGQFKLFEVELKLKSKQPIFERRRKHSLREWELVDQRCQELEAAGIIEECDNDFAANSVMAAKKDPKGNWKLARFCTDLRAINEQTAQDRYPMPLPEEVLEGLGHARFYSTIDIRGAFHQLVVKEADRGKLAFWSSLKLYCWKRCPFGARDANAWFQRAIDRTLRGFEAFARSFVDDLLVAGGETVEEHMELVQRVFDRLREVGLKCHPEKCCFAADLVEYLGMWLRPGVVSPQVAKVAAIAALPRPTGARQRGHIGGTDVTSVKAFSGMVNYYRQFIPNCSRLQAPLNELKGVPWAWDGAQEEAFLALKVALQGEPVLVLPRRGRLFKVRCDWSKKGIGGVLLQEDETGAERVVAYGSRSCNGAESRYSSFEGELLAAVYFVRLWRQYLYGERKFVLESDHQPLRWILTNTKLTGKLARWALMLSEFDFEVVHKPDIDNEMDCLSRFPAVSSIDSTGVRQEGELEGGCLWSAASCLAWMPLLPGTRWQVPCMENSKQSTRGACVMGSPQRTQEGQGGHSGGCAGSASMQLMVQGWARGAEQMGAAALPRQIAMWERCGGSQQSGVGQEGGPAQSTLGSGLQQTGASPDRSSGGQQVTWGSVGPGLRSQGGVDAWEDVVLLSVLQGRGYPPGCERAERDRLQHRARQYLWQGGHR
jgi:hypothetical protein